MATQTQVGSVDVVGQLAALTARLAEAEKRAAEAEARAAQVQRAPGKLEWTLEYFVPDAKAGEPAKKIAMLKFSGACRPKNISVGLVRQILKNAVEIEKYLKGLGQ